MRTCTVEISNPGGSPLSFSRAHETPKLNKEGADAYEERTWRERAHYDDKGELYIPPMMLKFCLVSASELKSEKIAGKGHKTWTKHFRVGVHVVEPVMLGVHKDKAEGEWVYCHADGKRTCGTRVWRCFPTIKTWKATAVFHVVDSTITEKAFEEHLFEAGNLVGLGRFAPRVGGYNGRFVLGKIKWRDDVKAAA